MSRRLLIVDDHREMAENLAEILEELGYEADVATSAEEALQRAGGASYLGMITDLRLPGRSGVELVEALRARGEALPVVLVSAYAAADDQARAEQVGALDVLSKPVDLKRLFSLVQAFEKADMEVLLVEDDPALRDNIADVLAGAGYQATVCASGEAALDHRRLPRMAIIDVCLPGIDGVEVAQRLFARDPALQVLVISGHVDDQLVEQVQRLPRSPALMQKPVSMADLTNMVRGES